jgi:hypothetical protein
LAVLDISPDFQVTLKPTEKSIGFLHPANFDGGFGYIGLIWPKPPRRMVAAWGVTRSDHIGWRRVKTRL